MRFHRAMITTLVLAAGVFAVGLTVTATPAGAALSYPGPTGPWHTCHMTCTTVAPTVEPTETTEPTTEPIETTTEEPTTEPTTEPTVEPTTTSTPSLTPVAVTTGGSLPVTGVSVGMMLVIAGFALAGGIFLVIAARTRKKTTFVA